MQTDTETYALLYCQYDSASGSRRYDLLSCQAITQLDIAVAHQAAKVELLTEITKIIYFGSPHAQQITNQIKRQQYAKSIVQQFK